MPAACAAASISAPCRNAEWRGSQTDRWASRFVPRPSLRNNRATRRNRRESTVAPHPAEIALPIQFSAERADFFLSPQRCSSSVSTLLGQVYVRGSSPLNHATFAFEEMRNVALAISKPRDRLGGNRFGGFTSFLHLLF